MAAKKKRSSPRAKTSARGKPLFSRSQIEFWECVWHGAIEQAENGESAPLEQLILNPRVPILQSALNWLAELVAGTKSIGPRRSRGQTSRVKKSANFIRQAHKVFLDQNPDCSKTKADEIFGKIYHVTPGTIRDLRGKRTTFADK